ncbi:unnamed protein product [Pleuronectes platessa]|uniref:Uncharacterized protein n=1 Tax=Pleuronectes platessa TaxID=8262 RepID=A0A9N7YXL2_PLEPL|nr:unnamed protein product [Pleuronectes platessa]
MADIPGPLHMSDFPGGSPATDSYPAVASGQTRRHWKYRGCQCGEPLFQRNRGQGAERKSLLSHAESSHTLTDNLTHNARESEAMTVVSKEAQESFQEQPWIISIKALLPAEVIILPFASKMEQTISPSIEEDREGETEDRLNITLLLLLFFFFHQANCPEVVDLFSVTLHLPAVASFSFPAVSLSTASPTSSSSSSSFLPPLSYFCLPAPLPLVSLYF